MGINLCSVVGAVVGRWAVCLVSMSYSPEWNIVADGCARALVAHTSIQFPPHFPLSLRCVAHEKR